MCRLVYINVCAFEAYQVEAGHAEARGPVFDVEEAEDVHDGQRAVEHTPAPRPCADVSLLRHQPEERRHPVEPWDNTYTQVIYTPLHSNTLTHTHINTHSTCTELSHKVYQEDPGDHHCPYGIMMVHDLHSKIKGLNG